MFMVLDLNPGMEAAKVEAGQLKGGWVLTSQRVIVRGCYEWKYAFKKSG